MVYVTYYLMNSEGTTLRTSRSLAAVEAALDTQADDGMPLHNYYSLYVARPADLPDPAALSKSSGANWNRADAVAREPAGSGLYRSGAFRRARGWLRPCAGSCAVIVRRAASAFHGLFFRRNHGAFWRPQRMDRARGHARASRRM